MIKRAATVNYLRSLADLIEALSETEVEAVLTGAGLEHLARDNGLQQPGGRDKRGSFAKAHELIGGLELCQSRETARGFLLDRRPSKSLLVQAADLRDIHITKADTIDTLIEKLISNVIGSKLDSEAIRKLKPSG